MKVNDPGSKVKLTEKTEKPKESVKKVIFSCNNCEYETMKKAILDKHVITKHAEHNCKDCKEKLPTFMALLKHVAEHHSEQPVEIKEVKDQGNSEIINEHTIIPKEINNSNTNIAEEEVEERDQLEELEAELYSLKMQLRVK